MKSVGLLGITIVVTFGYTQAPDTLWTRTYGGLAGDVGYSVQQTKDDGYIIAGWTKSFTVDCPVSQNVYLVKTDSLGETLWMKVYGGAADDWATEIHQTSDGGYIVVGCTESFGVGSTDFWLLKIDNQGDTAWTKTYGGMFNDLGSSVRQTLDGGYIIAGSSESFGAGGYDVYLIRTDSLGDSIWCKTYGGSAADIGESVEQTPDGYIIAGYTHSYGVGSSDVYILNTDSLGKVMWEQTCGGPYADAGNSICKTITGGFVVVGYTQSSGAEGRDIYLVYVEADGDTLWTQRYGGALNDQGWSAQETNDEGFIIVGYTKSYGFGGSDVYLIKTLNNGDTVWTNRYGGLNDDDGFSVQQTFDGGYIIAGSTLSFGDDIWLIRLAPDTLGIHDDEVVISKGSKPHSTVFIGAMQLPNEQRYRIFDITGRCVTPDKMRPGIYFVEVDGQITRKVIKVR